MNLDIESGEESAHQESDTESDTISTYSPRNPDIFTLPPLPNRVDKRALIIFQGEHREDAVISIGRHENRYKAYFRDREYCEHTHKYTFETIAELLEYIDLSVENVLLDEDTQKPFKYIEWDIPGFPNTIVEIDNIEERPILNNLHKLIRFYMNTSSTFL